MTEQETGTPEDSSRTNNSGGLGDLELEGLDLAVASPEAGAEEEDKINNTTTEEFPIDGGHEESEQEAIKWDYEEGEKIYEAQPSTALTLIACLLRLAFEASHPLHLWLQHPSHLVTMQDIDQIKHLKP